MPEIKRGDPKLISLDIQSFQIDTLKAKWDAIDVDEYTAEGLQQLDKSQGTLSDHLRKRASAIGKAQAPNDQNKQMDIARDYVLGAVFADEVMNTVPGFDQKINPYDLATFDIYLNSFPGNDNPYRFLGQVLRTLAPNVTTLILRAAEGKEPESKNPIWTGCVEMYSIKFMKAHGSLPSPSIFKR
jgi:hypothetical protein